MTNGPAVCLSSRDLPSWEGPAARCPTAGGTVEQLSQSWWSTQCQSDLGPVNTEEMENYQHYLELGFTINNLTIAVRIPQIKLRRPRFWRKKKTITSLSSSSSNSSSSSSTSFSSSEDWIRDFHARYNPLQTERSPYITSTPVRSNVRPRTSPALNVTGVKIYEYLEDLAEISEEEENSFDVVNVNNVVIARAVFSTLR